MALPTNLANGDLITEAWVDAVVNELTALPGRYAPLARVGGRWRRAALQSLATGANPLITWDTEDFDSATFATVPGTAIVVPAGLGGIYTISTQVVASSVTAGRTFISINIASAVVGSPMAARASFTGEDQGAVSATVPLLAGDSFTVSLFHNTGSTRDFTGFLQLTRVAV